MKDRESETNSENYSALHFVDSKVEEKQYMFLKAKKVIFSGKKQLYL